MASFNKDLSALSLLTRAPSTSTLTAYLSRVFILLPSATLRGDFPPVTITTLSDSFNPSLTPDEVHEVYKASTFLIENVLYEYVPGEGAGGQLDEMLSILLQNSKTIDPRVLPTLQKVLPKLLPLFHETSITNKVSPPKLTSINWRVDIPRSSNNITSLADSNSTLLLSLGVTPNGDCDKGFLPPASSGNSTGGEEKVIIEMDLAGVDTFLEGLSKIRDQLQKVS